MARITLSLLLCCTGTGLAAQETGAQLTVQVAPRQDRLESGASTLTFAALVRRKTYDLKVGDWVTAVYRVRVRCGSADCYHSPVLGAPAGAGDFAQVKFAGSFGVPSSVKPGTELCSVLEIRSRNLMTTDYVFGPVTTVCRKVLVPADVALGGKTPASATAQPGAKLPGGAARVRRGSRPIPTAASVPGAAARTALGGQLPDLELSFEKAPVARWLVRNRGLSTSPPTSVRFVRGATSTRMAPVPSIAAGKVAEIVVGPELDMFLVNASATVDPAEQIHESNESNNTWKSASSR